MSFTKVELVKRDTNVAQMIKPIDWVIDWFYDIITLLGLFYAEELINQVNCTFIFTFCVKILQNFST